MINIVEACRTTILQLAFPTIKKVTALLDRIVAARCRFSFEDASPILWTIYAIDRRGKSLQGEHQRLALRVCLPTAESMYGEGD